MPVLLAAETTRSSCLRFSSTCLIRPFSHTCAKKGGKYFTLCACEESAYLKWVQLGARSTAVVPRAVAIVEAPEIFQGMGIILLNITFYSTHTKYGRR